jgi:hypothetical protein
MSKRLGLSADLKCSVLDHCWSGERKTNGDEEKIGF